LGDKNDSGMEAKSLRLTIGLPSQDNGNGRDRLPALTNERIIEVKANRGENRIDTTLGDLIAAVSECAFEYSTDSREAYDLARLVLVELLKGASPKSEIIDWNFTGTSVVH